MAGLDDLYSQIPIQQIAGRLGVGESEVDNAVHTLVPVLFGGLQHNAADPDTATSIASAANNHAASGLLDGGVSVDQVDEADGAKAISKIFGGNDTGQVASALSGGGAGSSDLIKKLLPILAPIVLAYIGKQLGGGGGAAQPQVGGGGLGDLLGGILGGGGGGGDNPLGSILGSVLGGNQGGGLGDILGGLLGGRK
ncbi:DUF937 domain-containing protein [Mycolicibacterium sp.]|uniref:DUF937 domain-containing protein n=1 Tax=Mycolicibacterium sp. TaxID=2320850 RepID=UPI003D0F6D6C